MKLSPQLTGALVSHRSSPEKILALFEEAGLDAVALGQLNPRADPDFPYARAVLSAAAECEVMLARWAPRSTCAPHDHGASAGWVFYLEEDFEEQGYAWRSGELLPTWTTLHRAGTFTEVRRKEIHSCLCRGSGLSLHVYFPRIQKMRVFDLRERKTVTVTDDCGAWLPAKSEQRVHEAAWP